MNRKLKIIIIELVILIFILLTSKVFAVTPPLTWHLDPWSGKNELFSNNGWFCKYKHGAIRITPSVDIPSGVYKEETYKPCSSPSGSVGNDIKNALKENVKSGVLSRISESTDGWRKIGQEINDFGRSYNGIASNSYYTVTEVTGDNSEKVGSVVYCTTPEYSKTGSEPRTNDAIAYIFSSGEKVKPENFGLKLGNHETAISDEADDQLIQDALWCTGMRGGLRELDFNEGTRLTNPKIAVNLRREAQKYESYKNELQNYEVTLESNDAKVIVDRKNKKYIVGPYSVTYLDELEFSYIEDIYLIDDKGNKITPTVITSKGINTYPDSDKKFYIQFDATNNPNNVTLHINFAYLSKTYVNYDIYEGTGNINEIYGVVTKSTEEHVWQSGWDEDGNYWCTTDTHEIYKGYIYLAEKIGKYTAQKLVYVPDIELEFKPEQGRASRCRKWDTKEIKTKIDLTMELGGTVWEESRGEKETKEDGLYNKNTERPMSNVEITLYREDNKVIDTTKTLDDGSYKFTGLNSMYQYYVKFTYNGQYYQPTYYTEPGNKETWGNGNWKTNSNGTDKRAERIEYNIKFKSIESSPANYKGEKGWNETFTKQQLLGNILQEDGSYKPTGKAVIDDFGNLLPGIEKSTDTTIQKMIQYVKDCRMYSYTYSPDGKKDLYPIYDLFVIVDVTEWTTTDIREYNYIVTKYVNELKNRTVKALYDTANHINQGLVQREKADLALKKDVDNVTLEINGDKHKYTYDMLNKFKCNDCDKTGKIEEIITKLNENGDEYNDTCPYCGSTNIQALWDIGVRLSDQYYNTEYTRDLYPSDYLYRIDMYDNDPATYGKTEDDELKVFVTYKLVVKNQSQSIRCRVDEIVDYYDEDFTYVPERSYMRIVTGERKGTYSLENTDANKGSMYTNNGQVTEINGYNNLYIKDLGSNTQKIVKKDNEVKKEGNPISEGLYLNSGETVYIYLTFEVNKEDNTRCIILGEKENIAEINGYSTLYREGTEIPNVGKVGANEKAGLVDIDSNPGNLKPTDVPKDGAIKYNNFEDDTDKAPNIELRLDTDDGNQREISGVVWEDERTNEIESAIVGDGIQNDQDKNLINGVTVQLVELMKNGTEYVWKEFGANEVGTASVGHGTGSGLVKSESPIIGVGTVANYEFDQNNHKGQYAFKSFVPGQYIVRFIYGDTEKTAKPANLGGANSKSYNGQDYKSTTYQKDINATNKFEWREKSTWVNGQEILGDVLTEVETFKGDSSNNETAKATQKASEQEGYLYDILASDAKNNVSDAKDIESRREAVEGYSKENVTNTRAEVLASHTSYYQNNNYKTNNNKTTALQDLMTETHMIAETGLINIEFEYARNETDTKMPDQNTSTYKIKNVNLGLEERPKAQLIIDKEVTNVKLTLADGSTLFDASKSVNSTNVLWNVHKIYDTDYTSQNKMKPLDEIRTKSAGEQIYGLIQLTMDEELMHGATIKITYKITVQNVGEVDYKVQSFYYRGTVSDKDKEDKIVKTSANQVIDYVSNNLQFNKADNSQWNVIKKEDLITTDPQEVLVNKSLEETIERYNTIITTDKLSELLVPKIYKEKVKNAEGQYDIDVPLTLTQLITSENETDDLTYKNIVEIVKVSNTVGRRMEYSIVGNQDPTTNPTEVDSNIAQTIKILPPFGDAKNYIIIATTIIASISLLILGIVLIKKKVLNK